MGKLQVIVADVINAELVILLCSYLFLFYLNCRAFLGSEYDEEEVDYEESDSDESWTTESAISSEAILSSMCMNGGDEKPFACPVPGCKKRYKVSSSANPPHLLLV